MNSTPVLIPFRELDTRAVFDLENSPAVEFTTRKGGGVEFTDERETLTTRIRQATSSDAVAIADLLAQLGYPQPSEEVRPRLDHWLRDEASTVLVWDVDGQVLGVVAVHVMPFFEKPGFLGRVMVLVVTRGVRGTGVGRALLAAAEDFTRERGGVAVELTSNRRREAAHAFYRRRGYHDNCEISGRFLRELA